MSTTKARELARGRNVYLRSVNKQGRSPCRSAVHAPAGLWRPREILVQKSRHLGAVNGFGNVRRFHGSRKTAVRSVTWPFAAREAAGGAWEEGEEEGRKKGGKGRREGTFPWQGHLPPRLPHRRFPGNMPRTSDELVVTDVDAVVKRAAEHRSRDVVECPMENCPAAVRRDNLKAHFSTAHPGVIYRAASQLTRAAKGASNVANFFGKRTATQALASDEPAAATGECCQSTIIALLHAISPVACHPSQVLTSRTLTRAPFPPRPVREDAVMFMLASLHELKRRGRVSLSLNCRDSVDPAHLVRRHLL